MQLQNQKKISEELSAGYFSLLLFQKGGKQWWRQFWTMALGKNPSAAPILTLFLFFSGKTQPFTSHKRKRGVTRDATEAKQLC